MVFDFLVGATTLRARSTKIKAQAQPRGGVNTAISFSIAFLFNGLVSPFFCLLSQAREKKQLLPCEKNFAFFFLKRKKTEKKTKREEFRGGKKVGEEI